MVYEILQTNWCGRFASSNNELEKMVGCVRERPFAPSPRPPAELPPGYDSATKLPRRDIDGNKVYVEIDINEGIPKKRPYIIEMDI